MTADNPHPYLVDLEVFRGPLDLLLYLVRRDEVDIRDIPIAHIAGQFKQYLDVLALIDVEMAGDFLVMSSTLMEIKSKMLLPRPPAEVAGADGEDDPRAELVRQLLQYRAFQTAADRLDALADQHRLRHPRQPPPPEERGKREQPLRPVELWDLVSAFGRLMRETLTGGPSSAYEVAPDPTPLPVYMAQIQERLRAEPSRRLPFSAVFTPPYTRARLVGLFLAVLELTKRKALLPRQDDPFGDLWLELVEAG